MELLAKIQGGEAGAVIDSYFHGEKLHVLVGKERTFGGESIFANSRIKEITPAMEDVFAYLVKEESGKKLEGGRVSGTGESKLNIAESAAKEG